MGGIGEGKKWIIIILIWVWVRVDLSIPSPVAGLITGCLSAPGHERISLMSLRVRAAMLTCTPGCLAPQDKVCYYLSFYFSSNKIQAYIMPLATLDMRWYQICVTLHEWNISIGTWWMIWLTKCNQVTKSILCNSGPQLTKFKMSTWILDKSNQRSRWPYSVLLVLLKASFRFFEYNFL
jgi:hypothetical protein